MTDRIGALFVALEEDMRKEDAEELAGAIIQFRHVLNVEFYVSDVTQWLADSRARSEYASLLIDALKKERNK